MTKKLTKKTPALIRNHHDFSLWYTAAEVTERTEVETEWGVAMAEVGTFILTASDNPSCQIICTQSDLNTNYTTDPIPPLPEPGTAIEAQAVTSPDNCDLPGSDNGQGKDHGNHGA